ncbi:MAG: succinate dehydrogenase assembly factor 2 [Gammaproteobacteria bacterium]|nr:succinate dehydrogenase assembly factor 2 [Gammaproteobacteria bacterium]MDH5303269.1 succinate dehydrogenase assembly factor 2 [Gammaproteobacteria bacterium]
MRELDELLCRYLDCDYGSSAAAEKAAFQGLLQLPDPDVAGYLLQQRTPPPELAIVIQRILKRTGS